MSYNGSGTFVINSAGTPYVSGTVISSTAANALNSDLATGLSTAICKDGQSTPTANIGLGGFKVTNLGAGTVASDAARLSQVQNSGTTTLISITGTDTITGTVSPTLTAYTAGQVFSFVVAATNTGAVTLNINSLGATAVTRTGAVALVAGDMVTGQIAVVEYDGTRFQLINGNSFTNLKVSGTLGVTGITTVAAGAAATPSIISTTGTADTGQFFPAADTIAWSTAGSERVRFDSSGNVGIGTNAPSTEGTNIRLGIVGGAGQIATTLATSNSNAGFSVRGNVSSGFQLAIGATSGGDPYLQGVNYNGGAVSANLCVQAFGGYVGIGTTTPSSLLSVNGTLGVTGVTTVAAGSAAAPSIVSTTGTSDTGEFFPAADTIAWSTAGTERMRIGSTGLVGIGVNSPSQTLDVSGSAQLTFAGGNNYLFFQSTNNYVGRNGTSGDVWLNTNAGQAISLGVNGTEKVRIDSSGNVGIGTSSPGGKLEVVGGRTFLSAASEPYACGVRYVSTGGSFYFGAASSSATPDGVFCQSGGSERMRITDGGNVGIGTNSPGYQLTVNTDSAAKPGVGGLWTVASDKRIKTDIVPANLDRCYEIVKSIPLKHFGFAEGVYGDDQINDKHNLGWIAQDVQKVFNKAVSVKPFKLDSGEVIEDCLDLNSGQIIAALYGAVQALINKTEAQATRITALETL